MKRFRDWKNKVKFIAGFSTMAAVLAVVGVDGVRSLGNIQRQFGDIYQNQMLPVSHLAQVRRTIWRARANVLQHVLAQDTGKMRDFENQLAKLDTAWDEAVAKLDKARLTAEEKITLEQLKQSWAAFKEERNGQTLKLSKGRNKREAMAAALGETGQRLKEGSNAVDKMIEGKMKAARAAFRSGHEQYASARNATVAVLLIGMGVALFFGFMIVRLIPKPSTPRRPPALAFSNFSVDAGFKK